MRIVIPVSSLQLGSGSRLLAKTANLLADNGHQITVVIPEGKPIHYALNTAVHRVRIVKANSLPDGDIYIPN